MEISTILIKVLDQTFNQTLIRICKDSGIDINPLDIEDCHRLTLGRNSINTNE